MKRKFALFIAIFVLGLVTIISVVAWNLSSFADTLKSEKEGAVAFYRTSVDTSRQILGIVADVDKLFQAKSEGDLQTTQRSIEESFATVHQNLTDMKQERFAVLLQTPLGDLEQPTAAESTPQEEPAAVSDVPQETKTYADLVTEIEAGLQEASQAYSDVQNLASTKLRLALELAPLKDDLSKIIRENMDLRDVDPKAFNDLIRGAITVLYTTSGRDVKFAGNAKFVSGHDKLAKKELTDKQAKNLKKIKAVYEETFDRARLFIASNSDSAFFSRKARDVVSNINILEEQVQHLFDSRLTGLVEQSQRTKYTALVIAAIVTTISVAVGVVMAGGITRRISTMVARFQDISEGDLTQTVDVTGNDEIAALATAFNGFVEKINQTISEVGTAAQEVAGAAMGIAATSEDIARGMNDQNKELMQVSSAIEQMSSSVIEVARKSADAARNAGEAGATAETGGKIVQQVTVGMGEINKAVSTGAAAVTELGKRSSEIGKIIEVINDIADQTNLLALNAAIEAARAGEHGRGFAVVADEVRKLADRTTKATDQIAQSIKAIQADTTEAVQRMQAGTKQVNEGMASAAEAGKSLEQIVARAKEVAAMVESIAAAAEEQSSASQEVSKSVDSISSIAQKVASEGSKDSAYSVSGLVKRSTQLQASLSRFKLKADLTGDAAKWLRKTSDPVRILLVDDDQSVLDLLQHYLKDRGQCTLTSSGGQALSAFRSLLDQGRCYDLICLDIQMPDMDGRAVLAEIRKLEKAHGLGNRQRSRILMVTALTTPQDQLKAFRSECDGYLTKPIDKSQITEAVQSLGIRENVAVTTAA